MGSLPPGDAAGAAAGSRGRGDARADRLIRRLRDRQHGGGRRFGNAADVDLRHCPPRSESVHQRNLSADRGVLRSADLAVGTIAEKQAMNRRLFFLGLTGLAGCPPTPRPRLHIYTWSNHLPPVTPP